MFPKFPNSIVGPGENIEIPRIAQDKQADYEGELVIVIGKDAKNVSVEDAYNCVAGYTVGNDMSARKWQGNFTSNAIPPPQAGFSKAFDSFCPIGPCITAAHVSNSRPSSHSKLIELAARGQSSRSQSPYMGKR